LCIPYINVSSRYVVYTCHMRENVYGVYMCLAVYHHITYNCNMIEINMLICTCNFSCHVFSISLYYLLINSHKFACYFQLFSIIRNMIDDRGWGISMLLYKVVCCPLSWDSMYAVYNMGDEVYGYGKNGKPCNLTRALPYVRMLDTIWPAAAYLCGCGKLNIPCSESYCKLVKTQMGESRIYRQRQVFPEQYDEIFDYLVNLEYCWNFSPPNCSSLTRVWYSLC
jgi:hypothetical protein